MKNTFKISTYRILNKKYVYLHSFYARSIHSVPLLRYCMCTVRTHPSVKHTIMIHVFRFGWLITSFALFLGYIFKSCNIQSCPNVTLICPLYKKSFKFKPFALKVRFLIEYQYISIRDPLTLAFPVSFWQSFNKSEEVVDISRQVSKFLIVLKSYFTVIHKCFTVVIIQYIIA